MIILFALVPFGAFSSQQSYKNSEDTCRIVFGWRESESNTPLLEWMKKGGYTWGLELSHDVPENRIRELHKQGWNIVLFQLSHPETVIRYYNQKKRAIPNVNETVEKYIRATDGKVIWQNILEDESCGVGLSQEFLKEKPATHREAYKMTESYLRKSIAATEKQGNLPHWAVAGFANTAHVLAKQPEIDLLTVERANDDVDDLQTGISFFRGAGKQYSKQWGVDLSLWWGGIYGCVQNLPTLYHKRHLFVSWYSGAEHFRIEGSELFFDKTTKKPNRITECLDEFGAFIKSHERGKVEVPVAIVLPEDHGWITPPYWRTTSNVWNYAHIPNRQGQKALDGFFSASFPGSNFYMDPFSFGKFKTENPPASPFALSFISPEFAPDSSDVFSAEYPVSFGLYDNRQVARKEMELKQFETSEFRPMGNSRWGDIIDVLTTDVRADVLSQYSIIILLDQVELSNELVANLKNAMEGGSTVICSAGVITPEHADFTGAEIIPQLAVGQAWKFADGKMINEPYRYLPARLTSGRALASTANGSPLIIEKIVGKGKLISCMIPWFEGAPQSIGNAALSLFDKIISDVQPVRIEGLPLEYLSTKSSNNYNIVLSNNSNQDWKGKIIARNVDQTFNFCKELLNNQVLRSTRKVNGNVEVSVTIPAYEVRVVSWSK